MPGQASLTVLFEDPFWIGLYERIDGGRYQVCKLTFGAEPKDYEVYELLLREWRALHFSPPMPAGRREAPKRSPKRVRREINSRLEDRGVGTKAQQALSAQREQNKVARRAQSRAAKEAEKERQYTLRQEKKRAKHRGR